MFRLPIFLFGCLALTGCLTTPTTRSQSEDPSETSKPDQLTIGDVAAFANTHPIPVSGVGLVMGLDGTGGPQPPGSYRGMMEVELKKRDIPNIRAILDSKNHAIVLVSAVIPPGARKGDPIDVIVDLPPQSSASSLRGGYLTETVLFDYNTASNLNPGHLSSGRPDKLMLGDILVKVEGPLMMPLPIKGPKNAHTENAVPSKDEPIGTRKAFVWGCGRCMKDRPLFLSLNLDQQRARVSMEVESRVNQTFTGTGFGSDKLAVAKTKEIISVVVPPQYRLNMPRFMRVVCAIPLQLIGENSPYRYKLEEQVLDPATTLQASLRLEALGASSLPALKPGLKSGFPLVRFATAEAITYLGQTDGTTELGQLVTEQPALQAYCLTALGSLDEAKCHRELMVLLSHDVPEVRYGAFRALRLLDPRSDISRGEKLAGSFWLHRIAPQSPGMIHVLSGIRPEIVLFGETPKLTGDFTYVVGPEFTVTANRTDSKVTISRFSVSKGKSTKQADFALSAVITTLAEMGATYNDVFDLLRQADACKSLSCALAIDAMPSAKSVPDLAKLGASSSNLTEPVVAPVIVPAGAEVPNGSQ